MRRIAAASGIFTGYALLATTGVLQALSAAGPTPHRVRAALPSGVSTGPRGGGRTRQDRRAVY
jgi:ATP-binding cassette subfamily B protein/ATP-binding cassette subfamily C protein